METKFEHTLRQHYLFAALDDAQWRQLAPYLHLRLLAMGEGLFAQNDAAGVFFVVLDGTVKLYRLSGNGQEKVMRLVYSGQSFAESILFTDPPRYPVHAQALAVAQVVTIARGAYLDLLRISFDTCRAVMAQMTQRIYSHWDEIEALSLSDSHQRVAQYLLSLIPHGAPAAKLQLPARKSVIAAQLGLAPETLSRILRFFSDRGLIEVRAMVVDILDPHGLHAETMSSNR